MAGGLVKLHSDTITLANVLESLPEGVSAETARESSAFRGSGIVFRLYREEPGEAGRRRPRNRPHVWCASYDEHGELIAALFEIDPDAIIGQYKGVNDFHEQTKGVFA